MDDGTDASSPFLDALRTRAMDDLHEAALEYGIVLKDLAVIDRQFKGESRLVNYGSSRLMGVALGQAILPRPWTS